MIDLDAHMRSLAQVLGARALEGAIRPLGLAAPHMPKRSAPPEWPEWRPAHDPPARRYGPGYRLHYVEHALPERQPSAPRRAPRGWRRHVRRSNALGHQVAAQPPRIAKTFTTRVVKLAQKYMAAMIMRDLGIAPEKPYTQEEMRRAVAGACVACGVWRSYSRSLRRRWWRARAQYWRSGCPAVGVW